MKRTLLGLGLLVLTVALASCGFSPLVSTDIGRLELVLTDTGRGDAPNGEPPGSETPGDGTPDDGAPDDGAPDNGIPEGGAPSDDTSPVNPETDSLLVTFGSVQFVPSAEAATEQAPVTVATESKTVDLFELQDSGELLGELELPSGSYSQLRLVVESAELVRDEGAENEARYDVTVPSGSLKINLDPDLVVEAGAADRLLLAVDAAKALVETPAGSGNYLLKPTAVRAVGPDDEGQDEEDPEEEDPVTVTGTLAGTVVDASSGTPLVGAQLSVTDGSGEVVSTATDSDGAFTVTDLAEGVYTINVSADGYLPVDLSDVGITAGETTTLDNNPNTPELALELIPQSQP